MASDKQVQKAGDNSTQIQANAVYVVGIDEKRAREVYTEMSEQTIAQCTSEAAATANARIGKFKEELIPRVERIEKDFRSFSDPSFQVLLKKAQLTAACTGRDSDYAILAELLTHRIKNKDNVKKKASIQRAIEVIDQIDDDSLVALATLHAVSSFWPLSGQISTGIQNLSALYEKIGCFRLPADNLWIDNLLVVGAINVIPFSALPKYEERFKSLLDGYVATGIKKGGDNYQKAVDVLLNCQIFTDILVDHELLPGYVRLPFIQKRKYDGFFFTRKQIIDGGVVESEHPISKQQIDCLNRVFDFYEDSPMLQSQVEQNWHNLLCQYAPVRKTMEWWDSLKGNYQLTAVGRTIAHTYAKQIDPNLPDLD